MRRSILALTLCAVLAAPAAASGAAKHDWTRFGVNAARSNFSTAVAGIKPGDLAGLVRQDVTVPGTVDSSPIYLHDVRVKGQKRDVFVVTTSYGRTLAIGANTGQILWVYTPPTYDSLVGSPQYSVSSPLADRKAGVVYAPTPDGHIRKLSLKNGAEVLSDKWPAAITRDAAHEKISSSLNMSGRYVIATTAGYGGDIPPYQGHVALVDRESGELKHVWNALCADKPFLLEPATGCGEHFAGIWARGGAIVIPGSRQLLVVTGNADWNGTTNWGDSVLRLSPDATKLRDSWTPSNQHDLDAFDVDLGSTAPALMRSGKRWLGLQGGKDGDIRLLDIADMNGHGGPCKCLGGELQFIHTPGDDKVVSTPAIWRHGDTDWAFVTTYQFTTAYRLSKGKNPQLRKKWTRDRGGSSPVIAGGLLYILDPIEGGIAVYRPESGKRIATLPTDTGHWNSPVVADGRVATGVGNANEHPSSGIFTIFRKP